MAPIEDALAGADATPIAQLNPQLGSAKVTRGVVTIVWPYNSVKNTVAFILAEPEFRLRYPKGQIRIEISGSSAKQVSEHGLNSGDEAVVSLEGGEWVADESKRHDWQLKFSERLLLQIKGGESGKTKSIDVNHPPVPETQRETTPESAVEPPAAITSFELSPVTNLPILTPARNGYISNLEENEFESPAFIKRARVSYGSLFDGGLDIFDDDGGVKGKGRKKARFGRHTGAWRYTSQSPSPEPEVSQHRESNVEDEEERPRSSPRLETTDEGCQTMELDNSSVTPPKAAIAQPEVHQSAQVGNSLSSPTLPKASIEEPKAHEPTEAVKPFANSDPLNQNQAGNPFVSNGSLGQAHETFPVGSWPEMPVSNPTYTSTGTFSNGQAAPFGSNIGLDMTDGDFQQEWNPAPVIDEHPVAYPELSDNAMQTQPGLPDDTHESESLSQSDLHPAVQSASNTSVLFPRETTTVPANPFARATRESRQQLATVVSSWSSVNNDVRSASRSLMGSADGQTPESAMVIGESDSEDEDELKEQDVTKPTTFDGAGIFTGDHQRIRTQFQAPVGAEAEGGIRDEPDAHYSDDDEPEYDEDERGGDYDARNYLGPADDEDDSQDEDLGTHNLEPEFDDGQDRESWGEDEEDYGEDGYDDEDDQEYGSEYDMEDDEQQPAPAAPARPSEPVVIDLLSSSDDENDEDIENQPPSQFTARDFANSRSAATATDLTCGPLEDDFRQGEVEVEDDKAEGYFENLSGEEDGDHASDYEGSEAEGLSDGDVVVQDGLQEVISEEDLEEVEMVATRLQSDSARSKSRSKSPANIAVMREAAILDQSHVVQVSETVTETRESVENFSLSQTTSGVVGTKGEREIKERDEERGPMPVISSAESPPAATSLLNEVEHRIADEIAEPVVVVPSSPPSTHPTQRDAADDAQDVIMDESGAPAGQLPTPLNTQLKDQAISQETTTVTTVDAVMVDEPLTVTAAPSIVVEESLEIAAEEIVQIPRPNASEENRQSSPSAIEISQQTELPREAPHLSFLTQVDMDVDDTQISQDSEVSNELPDMELQRNVDVENREGNDSQSEKSFGEAASFVSQLEGDDALQAALMEEDSQNIEQVDNEEESAQSSDGIFSEAREVLSEYEDAASQGEEAPAVEPETRGTLPSIQFSSPALGITPRKEQRDVEQELEQNADVEEAQIIVAAPEQMHPQDEPLPTNESDIEPSVRLARDPPVSRRGRKKREANSGLSTRRSMRSRKSSTPDFNEIVRLAKGSSDQTTDESIIRPRTRSQKGSTPDFDESVQLAHGTPSKDIETSFSRPQTRSQKGSTPDFDESVQLAQGTLSKDIETSFSRTQTRSQKGATPDFDESVQLAQGTPSKDIETSFSRPQTRSQKDSTPDEIDASVQLAQDTPFKKASNNTTSSQGIETNITRPQTRSQKTPRPEVNESVQLAKDGSNATTVHETEVITEPPKEVEPLLNTHGAVTAVEEGTSISDFADSRMKLQHHLSNELPEYASLIDIQKSREQTIDIMAVAMMKPPQSQRAKGGPREYMMSFTVTDFSIAPDVVEVKLYRPHKESLPRVNAGDVVILHDFQVKSQPGKGYGLRTTDTSSWAVFDKGPDEPAQIKGAPLEYGRNEEVYAVALNEWFKLLDEKARGGLENANKKIVEAGKPKPK